MNTLNIYNEIILGEEEQKNLMLLYNPLIGTNAIGLYYTFYFLSKNNNLVTDYKRQLILDILNIDQATFTKLKEKLEAIRLLNTFKHKEKSNIIYYLESPLKSASFFQDPIFSHFLLSEIGEENYFYLQQKCSDKKISKINFDNYHHISKKFTDVYFFQKINFNNTILKYNHFHENENYSSKKNIFEKYFDYSLFISSLPERFQKPFLLKWNNIDYITKIAYVYGIDPKEMASLYQEYFRNSDLKLINVHDLKIIIKRRFLKNNYSIKLAYIKNEDSDNREKEMIFYLKNTSPSRIIENFIKNKYLSADLCDIVEKLLNQSEIDPGVINALMMYVCKLKASEEKFPTNFNYFKTILNSWTQKGIISTETAYDFLVEDRKNTNNFRKKNNRPKWLDDIDKELGIS
ncbi:DnaD domain protein [Candidatus Phytoplasma pini]|uniref:Replicative DNA helicase DnaB-like n=1 Tax=Candidatus Phytoplasma pini TaxID=267362 RepID=A0A559KJI2_9MOLU|nr:DnaD domain protein [Candidatus Phytoplasma pini]TVY12267.1 Replicative DNA helicase DnaB-like [Candidatus Phytoplasma pini]